MIRFPNPGSDVPSLIRIFKTLYSYLQKKTWFTLDDMSETLTSANLAASSGYVGEKALYLSTRADRSRDPLYNQSKMYAELFRTLGWIVSEDPNTALKFRFTLLGDHAAIADVDPKAIFEESLLGINYPNRVIAMRGTEASRVFSTILRASARLNGYICRDEIIIGILNKDDVGDEAIDDIVATIKSLRGNATRLVAAMSEMSRQIKIQINTMRNYTRFPLAVLTFCGWFDRESTNEFYPGGRAMPMLKMTPYGRQRADELETAVDIRLSDYEAQTAYKQMALIRLGFYSMLQRANFDISPAIAQIATDRGVLSNISSNVDLVFSPYQTIRPEIADDALGHSRENGADAYGGNAIEMTRKIGEEASNQIITTIKLRHSLSADVSNAKGSEIEQRIRIYSIDGLSDEEIVEILFKEYRFATKEVFYPLVADLFNTMGFRCQISRAGINYERWDAIAVDESKSVPIEIKSPMEELFISVKAIRQALENKVILLSRKSHITDWETASLAVGYNPPNDRAEVSRLITDIKKTFDVRIGVIDFRSLILIACDSIRGDGDKHVKTIRNMEGLIRVESI